MALWTGLGQAATVAQLVGADVGGLISMIVQAAITARQNKSECEQLARRVLMIAQLLPHVQEPEAAQPLAGLGDTLRDAHELVVSCQGRSAAYQFVMAGRTDERFREVQGKIDSYLILFPVISHIGITRRLERIYNVLVPDASTTGEPPCPLQQSLQLQESTELAQEVPPHGIQEFTLAEIVDATNNFAPDNVIGKGGSGKVYKGKLYHGREVAIKHLNNSQSQYLEEEFCTELDILSRLRHKHIISLIGSCVTVSNDKRPLATLQKKKKRQLTWWRKEPEEPQELEELQRFTVYECMVNGTLFDHIHPRRGSSTMSPVAMSWEMRIAVLLGVSRAIEHLHCHANPPIIHRDVKPSNILLDASWVSCLSDFGLSVVWDMASEESGLELPVEGTYGHADPEYLNTGLLKPASDVYSLGVVVLEVLTGKGVVFYAEEMIIDLVSFALPIIEAGNIVSPPCCYPQSRTDLLRRASLAVAAPSLSLPACMASTPAGIYGRLNRTSTRAFLAYFAGGAACAAALACFVVVASTAAPNGAPRLSSRSARVWPDLEFNWRLVVATVVGFLGSAFGTVGGVGGGGIFVPLLNLVLGFDTKSAAALSKCMIMGASASSVWYNLQVSHPTKEAPVLDYKLALLFQPMLMLGITIGVELSVVFPYWLITVLIIILFVGTSSRSFYKGILMWREETRILMETRERETQSKSSGASATNDVVLDPSYAEPLLPQSKPTQKSGLETLMFNLRWKHILVLLAVWSSFLVLQILKNNSKTCSTFYWVINIFQIPAAVSVFVWKAVQLCRESRARRMNGNLECVCEANIEWSPTQLIFCAFCGLLGGTVGGLLGSGGGFILGPLLLELGCIPQVASATATFVMMFSSSLSVVEFYFLGRFPIPYALYLIFISILAGFWGQCLVRKIVLVLKRASLIVFILSSVIFASALTMGVVGTEKSISMINKHEYMGFLSFCG